MARKLKKKRSMVRFDWCTLTLSAPDEKKSYVLSGNFNLVGMVDREKIASLVARHMGIAHEEAYSTIWDACAYFRFFDRGKLQQLV